MPPFFIGAILLRGMTEKPPNNSHSVGWLSILRIVMALSKELVEQFQALHLAHFGKVIDSATAEREFRELIELVRITAPKKRSSHAKATYSRSKRASTN